MQLPKPTTQETLITYLLFNISLGTYDKRFLNNIMSMNVLSKKPVTTNQADLLKKITLRYRKQLAKHELYSEELCKLPWTLTPINSLPEYTQAYIRIEDDKIFLTSPYKTSFINDLRKLSYMKYDKELKVWSCFFTEKFLKTLIELSENNYNVVKYCSITQTIISTIEQYIDIKYWDPTLVERNNNLFIYGTNKFVDKQIEKLQLSTELSCLARLTHYGIKIDKDLLSKVIQQFGNNNEAIELVRFATSVDSKFEMSDHVGLAKCIKFVQPDLILMSTFFSMNDYFNSNILESIKHLNIPVKLINRNNIDEELQKISRSEFVMVLNTGLFKHSKSIANLAGKNVLLVNSIPINI